MSSDMAWFSVGCCSDAVGTVPSELVTEVRASDESDLVVVTVRGKSLVVVVVVAVVAIAGMLAELLASESKFSLVSATSISVSEVSSLSFFVDLFHLECFSPLSFLLLLELEDLDDCFFSFGLAPSSL